MTDDTTNLAALIGSRICHDLISPVGAVTNGMELLAMSGIGDCPELDLVNTSAEYANTRLRLFRVAFGTASQDQSVNSDEMRRLLSDHYPHGRLTVTWQVDGDAPRPLAKAALLGVMCIEQSLPTGGQITITASSSNWTICGTSDQIKEHPELWAGLSGTGAFPDLAPAEVQYPLLYGLLKGLGRLCYIGASGQEVRLEF